MKTFNFNENKGEVIEDNLPQAWNFDDNKVMQGYFIGTEENIGKNNSTIYKFETEEYGEIAVWETAQLKRILAACKIGEPYEIKFIDFIELKNSDNQMRKFQVTKLFTE